MKNVNITPPNKMHNLLQKLETYKMQNNPKRYSVEKMSRKNSINFHQEQENFVRRNSFQKPNLNNVNTQALQTLSDAALKVKNLLSDFLINADPDDKQKFNIEEELNEIKKNKNNDNLNLYTLIGDNSGKSSNNESDIDNINNYIRKEKKNIKRKSDLVKRNSMLLSFNDDDFKNYSRGISYKKPKIKNLKIYSMDNTNEDTLNAINKIRSLKNNIKRNSKNSFQRKISSNDNLFVFNNLISSNDNLVNLNQRKSSAFSFGKRSSANSSNSFKRKSSDDKFVINSRKSSDNVLNFKKRFSEKNIKQNLISHRTSEKNVKNNNIFNNLNAFNNFYNLNNNNELKSSFLGKKKINKHKVHFNFIGKDNNDIKKVNSDFKFQRRKKRIDTFQMPSLNIQNNNNLLKTDRIKSQRDFKKSKTLKFGDTLIEGINLSSDSTYSKDNDDIRNYIPLSKKRFKEFNNLCKNLRKSIVFSSEDKKNLLNKFGIENEEISKKSTIKTMRIDGNKSIIEQDKKIYKEDDDTINTDNEEIHDIKLIEFQYRRLIRQNKYVYDSLSDEESLDDADGEFYIDPNNKFKLVFDSILFFLSIFSVTYPIYVFAFKYVENCPSSNKLIIFQITYDIFCIIDLIIGFFSAYYNFEEQLITNNGLICIHYIKGWFILDFLSAIPFNSFFIFFPLKNFKKDKLRYIKDNSLNELLILIRLLKLFKVFMKNEFVNLINNLIEGIDALVKWSRVYLSLFIGIASIHVLSCIFIFLGTLQFPNWIYQNEYELSNQKGDIYISAFYFISVTVLTVGYGDICTISLYERFFNLILLVVGIMIYSYAVSALSNYVSSVDSKTLEYQNKLTILENIRVTHEKMPQSLFDKISKFLLYQLNNETRDKSEIIDNLPSGLRNKLILEMYRDIIYNFIFFKKFDNSDFIIQVILAMKPLQASHNERLVNEGEYIEEIYFVKRGVLSLEIPLPIILKEETIQKMETIKISKTQRRFGIKNATLNFLKQSTLSNGNISPSILEIPTTDDLKNSKTQIQDVKPTQNYIKIIEIRRNEHFGDILMFLNKRSPLSVKVKSKVCELFLLKKTDAVEISMNFPKIWRKIIKKSLFNMEQIERLINKALKFFFVHNEGHKLRRNSVMKENYYRIDPTKQNKLLNSNNLYQHLDTTCELKSIPSEGDDEDSSYTNTEENEKEGENDNDKKSSSSISSHYESLKKEINSNKDSNSDSSSKFSKKDSKYSRISKKSKSTFKDSIKTEILSNEDNNKIIIKGYDNYIGSDLETLRENENSFNQTKSNKTINSNTSRMSEQTVKTVIKNTFDDYKSVYNEKDLINGNPTLIPSNSLTLPYSLDEINNENLPFEEPINIPTEEIPVNLLPQDIINHINLNMKNDQSNNLTCDTNIRNNNFCNNNNNFDFFDNNINTIINNNNITSIINNNNITSIINGNEKDIKFFKNLSWHRIISFTIFGIKRREKTKTNKTNKMIKINTSGSNRTNRTNKSNKSNKTNKSKKKNQSLKSIENYKNSTSPKITFTNSKEQYLNINNSNNNNNSNNIPNSPVLSSKDLNTPKNKKQLDVTKVNNTHLHKSRSLIGNNNDRRLSKLIFTTAIPKIDFDTNENNEKDKDKEISKEKIKSKIKNSSSKIRISRTLNNEHINTLLQDNNKENIKENLKENNDNKNKPINKNKRNDTLHLISQNISQNSINLNDPNKFYSNYFSSIIGKTDLKTNENGVSQRLNKLKAFIQNHQNKNPNNEPPN